MLRRILAWIAAIVAGVVLGAASAWAALEIRRVELHRTLRRLGAQPRGRLDGGRSLHARHHRARGAAGALARAKRSIFRCHEDEQGRPLSESCIYELNGRPLDARWWSVTLYADDNFLAQNTDNAHSIDASRVGNDARLERAHLAGAWRRARIGSPRAKRGAASSSCCASTIRSAISAPATTSLPVLTHGLLRGRRAMSWGKYVLGALVVAVARAFRRDLRRAARADERRHRAHRRRRRQRLARAATASPPPRARSCAPRPTSPIPPAPSI